MSWDAKLLRFFALCSARREVCVAGRPRRTQRATSATPLCVASEKRIAAASTLQSPARHPAIAAKPARAPPPPPRRRLLPLLGGLALAVGLALQTTRAGSPLWCNARGINLGTIFTRHGFSLERMPDLTGRIALVTGANTGLGYEVARQLVFANATVMMACRELLPCHAAQRAIALEAGNIPRSCDPNQGASIHEGRRCHAGFGMVEVLDLNNLTMVAELVADLAERPEPYNRVDLLVNNAGVAAQYPLELTGDGVEGTFQANYLGHWHLTTGLLPLLERGARATGRRARVVHLTSGAHRGAPADGVPLTLDGVNDEGIRRVRAVWDRQAGEPQLLW